FVLVDPVIGRCQADGALADRQQPRRLLLEPADGVPAAGQEEDPAPGGKAVGDQRRIVPEEITPAETGALEQVDLAHNEVSDRRPVSALVALPDMPAKGTFDSGEWHHGLALRADLGGRLTIALAAVEIDVLFQ